MPEHAGGNNTDVQHVHNESESREEMRRQSKYAARILALDASGESVSVALRAAGRTLQERTCGNARQAGEKLLVLVEEVLRDEDLRNVDAFAATLGPGRFTGIRIALAAAKGLALGMQKPLLGVDSFTALLAGVSGFRSVCKRGSPHSRALGALLPAKAEHLFLRLFSDRREPRHTGIIVSLRCPPLEELRSFGFSELILFGTQAEYAAQVLSPCCIRVGFLGAPTHIQAKHVAEIAAHMPLPCVGSPSPKPFYLLDASARARTSPPKRDA